jgi:hypothetical protein
MLGRRELLGDFARDGESSGPLARQRGGLVQDVIRLGCRTERSSPLGDDRFTVDERNSNTAE